VGHAGRDDFLGRARAPPSVLPDISPARGEIGSFAEGAFLARSAIGESRNDTQSPSLSGRCPVGQRGVPGAIIFAGSLPLPNRLTLLGKGAKAFHIVLRAIERIDRRQLPPRHSV